MSEVEALEQQLKDTKTLMERKKLALRLAKNADFRKLVLEGFCRDEAARYVQQSVNPALKEDERADALGMAQASGHLLNFLSMQIQMASVAERDLPNLEEAITEARASEVQDVEV
jgi:hypothetical protein